MITFPKLIKFFTVYVSARKGGKQKNAMYAASYLTKNAAKFSIDGRRHDAGNQTAVKGKSSAAKEAERSQTDQRTY